MKGNGIISEIRGGKSEEIVTIQIVENYPDSPNRPFVSITTMCVFTDLPPLTMGLVSL